MSPTFHESFAAFKTINAIYNLVDLTSREQQDASKMKKIIKQILHTAKISEDAPLLFSFKARFYFIRLAEVSCEFQHDEFDKNFLMRRLVQPPLFTNIKFACCILEEAICQKLLNALRR